VGGDQGGAALVVVDMLNTYDHDDAERLADQVERALPRISSLIERARESDVDLIYVNDNYDDWHTSAERLSERALDGRHPELVEPVLPAADDPFVVKARHTIFYGTPLEYLLFTREVSRLILVGQVTEQCILYSALDAYVRHFDVVIPHDAVAPIHPELGDAALKMMERNMRAELVRAEDCRLD
jgi:nicotinamidase-related amidase